MLNLVKDFRAISFKKYLIPLLFLSIFSLLIWYLGPIFIDSLILKEKRFYFICGVYLAWIFTATLFNNTSLLNGMLPFTFNNPELTKKLFALEARFNSAMKFLKNNKTQYRSQQINLNILPWFLIIGGPHSGKTTLLANSDLPYILSKKFKNQSLARIPPSETCDWWVTKELVFVDVPGSYLYSRLKNPANTDDHLHQKISPHNILWKSFLSLLTKHRGKKNSLAGVILTLPLPELISHHQNKERILLELKQRVTELQNQFGRDLPFYLIITKCDLLPGFVEFFADSGKDELAQTWGITLPFSYSKEQFLGIIETRFNTLIQRLNKQLIWRLHQERNSITRPQIKDFPLHVERLKEEIISIFRGLNFSETEIKLQGIHLTSAIQQHSEMRSGANVYEASALSQTTHLIKSHSIPCKPYFIRHLLMRGLATHLNYTATSTVVNWKDKRFIYSLIAIISLTAIISGEFFHNKNIVNNINDAANQYEIIKKDSDFIPRMSAALPLLNSLEQAAEESSFPFSSQTKLAKNAYDNSLQKIVLLEIKSFLENCLQNETTTEVLYRSLKTYLMLGNKEKFDDDYFIKSLDILIPKELAQNKNFKRHMSKALNNEWSAQHLDSETIKNARLKLLNLTPTAMTYGILKSNFLTKLKTPTRENFFNANQFNLIYSEKIANAVNEFSNNNWILNLGDLNLDSSALINQVHLKYIADYANTWEIYLNKLLLPTPKNLIEVNNIISGIINSNSMFSEELDTIRRNTDLAPIIAANSKLAQLNRILDGSDSQKIKIALTALHLDLEKILNSKDNLTSSFQATLAHINNSNTKLDSLNQLFQIAPLTPTPINNWLNTIATATWHSLLINSATYIQTRWTNDVLAVYNNEIENKFPFAENASQEVPLSQFNNFLGTQGLLSQFFQSYLQPFADNQNKNWTWKKIHNEQIPFSELALNQLQHAANLQRAFFPNGSNQVHLKFNLQPIALGNQTKTLQLNIEGQAIQFSRGNPVLNTLIEWPSNNNNHLTGLNLLNQNGQLSNDNNNSEWGLFRLINKSIQKIVTPNELMLNFELDENKATCLLTSNGDFNPFLPTNLESFRLPQNLMAKHS